MISHGLWLTATDGLAVHVCTPALANNRIHKQAHANTNASPETRENGEEGGEKD